MIQANPLPPVFVDIRDNMTKLTDSIISGLGYAAGGLFLLYVIKFGHRHFK